MPRRRLIPYATAPAPITCKTLTPCVNKLIRSAEKFVDEGEFDRISGNVSVYIENQIMRPFEYYKQRKAHSYAYQPEDLANMLNVLVETTNIINKKVRYTPTLLTYCRLLCISTSTFNTWTGLNDDKGEQARLVQDYFRSTLTQGMITNEINPAAGTFIGKSVLAMKDSEGQQTNINIIGDNRTVDEILADYEKNLLTIKTKGDNVKI